jgi:2'-5' RNA ligase
MSKRLFIAIPLNDECFQAFTNFEGLRIDPANLHITALFIGEVNVEEVDEIIKRSNEIALKVAPFELEFDRIMIKRGTMIWGLFKDSEPFKKLNSDLAQIIGIEMEREQIPHVTLARLKEKQWIDLKQVNIKNPLIVDRIILFESHLSNLGAKYLALKTFMLGVQPVSS